MTFVSRTYGWVQNPSDFAKLKITVKTFDSQSEHYIKLKNSLVEDLIYFPEIKENLQSKLNNNITEFSYSELVGRNIDKHGRSPKKRKDAVADSLLQISILPQNANTMGKRYTDDWTADGFLRWAVSLNFIQPNRDEDTYQITELGISFSRSVDDSKEELSILRSAFLSYPPATRVMEILDRSNTPKNKFYIGQRLGFSGEKGFTSYDGKLMEDFLLEAGTTKERSKIRSDIEGTSDKYARMIASWLRKVGYIESHATKLEGITSFQTYSLTAIGKLHLNRSKGRSSNTKHPKYVMWEFLATNVSSRNYVRTRRTYIIKSLMRSNSYNVLLDTLRMKGFDDDEAIIRKDINRLINFGLRIEISKNWSHVVLRDVIIDFDTPNVNVTQALIDRQSDQEKAFFLTYTEIPDKFVELLSIAYDGNANRDFELITAELLRDVYQLDAIHLGGGRKPDGVAYTDKFGILYDTKAYSKGYSSSISEQDKMIRYVVDNQIRSEERNPTCWWDQFPDSISNQNYYYLWISSEFKRDIDHAINYVSKASNGAIGGALSVHQLLIGAAKVQKGLLAKEDLPNYINNTKIHFGNRESLVN